MVDPEEWVLTTLARAGLTPLTPAETKGFFTTTGFTVEPLKPDAAVVTVTARYTGQDAYDHWGEAQQLAERVMDVLQESGAAFEEVEGREPNCVFEVYPPVVGEAQDG